MLILISDSFDKQLPKTLAKYGEVTDDKSRHSWTGGLNQRHWGSGEDPFTKKSSPATLQKSSWILRLLRLNQRSGEGEFQW